MGKKIYEYKQHWLHRRRDTPIWYVYWCRPGTRRVERRSTGTPDFEKAREFLIAFVDGSNPVAQSTSLVTPSTMPASPTPVPAPVSPAGVPLLDVLTTYVESLKGRSSHETAQHVLKFWIEFCAHANVVYVHEMTLTVQERFVAWRRASRRTGLPISNGTMNRYLDVLRASFYDAWRRGTLGAFPYVRLLPKPAPRDRFLTQEEAQRLLAECHTTPLYRFVLLGLHTLQRPSAILGLRTEQIDLEWNRINFLPAGSAQSNKRKPVVPITSVLRPELERAVKESKSGHVIEWRGHRVSKLRKSFKAAALRAKLPHATPGILRHSGATLLAAAGVPIREISGMLGHTTSAITESVYAKRRPEFLSGAARELERLFPSTRQLDDLDG